MAEVVKQWDDGTRLFVDCGESEAVFTSEPNEGIDREMGLTFRNASGAVAEAVVTQEGLREPFITADGYRFCGKDGEVFGVLKVTEPAWKQIYKEVEYIQSSGKQYINTGVKVTPDYTIEVTFVMTKRNATWDTLFGIRNSSQARFTARWANSATGKLGVHRSKGKTVNYEYIDDANAAKTMVTDTWHTIKLAKREYTFDGELRKTFSATTNTATFPYPIYLFALCNAGSPADYGYFRIKKARIWDDKDELIRDYVPCVDPDGVAGMYDVVNDTFSKSGSTTAFAAGALID